jgi:hypothetical protein
MPLKVNLVGPHGQLYADPKPSPDENAFQVDNTREAYYNSPYYLLHKSQVQPIPPRGSGTLPYLKLADFIPQDLADAVNATGKITFHAVGDTGRRRPLGVSLRLPRLPSKPPSPTPWLRTCNRAASTAALSFFTWEM